MNINWKLLFKIVTGIFVVPVTIAANALWPWWQNASMPARILSAPFVLPIVGIAIVTAFWWEGLKS